MNDKSIEALRNGLEDSYWYGAEDAEVFEEMKRKAEAYDAYQMRLKEEIQKLDGAPFFNDWLKRNGMVSALDLLVIVAEESGDRP